MPATRKRKASTQDTLEPVDTPASEKRRSQQKTKSPSAITSKPNSNITSAKADSQVYKTFTIHTDDDKVIRCQLYGKGPKSSSAVKNLLIFTHGAGGGLDDSTMKLFAEGYASAGMSILCFQGAMNLKNRVKSFEAVLGYCKKEYSGYEFFVGGRSMGARAAVMLAGEHGDIRKIVAGSYPLVSPKGDVRDEILIDLVQGKKICFISGDQDNMCGFERLEEVREKMRAASKIVAVKNADHGMSLVGSVKDKANAIEEIRRLTGQIAAQWVRGEYNGDEQMVELRWDQNDREPIVESKGVQEDGVCERKEAEDHETEQSKSKEKDLAKKKRTKPNTHLEARNDGKGHDTTRTLRSKRNKV